MTTLIAMLPLSMNRLQHNIQMAHCSIISIYSWHSLCKGRDKTIVLHVTLKFPSHNHPHLRDSQSHTSSQNPKTCQEWHCGFGCHCRVQQQINCCSGATYEWNNVNLWITKSHTTIGGRFNPVCSIFLDIVNSLRHQLTFTTSTSTPTPTHTHTFVCLMLPRESELPLVAESPPPAVSILRPSSSCWVSSSYVPDRRRVTSDDRFFRRTTPDAADGGECAAPCVGELWRLAGEVRESREGSEQE